MGVNPVTTVRNFSIENRTFSASDHGVQDGCVTLGLHRLLRFDFFSHSAGDADLVMGSPAARPDLVWSAGHGHHHLKDLEGARIGVSGASRGPGVVDVAEG